MSVSCFESRSLHHRRVHCLAQGAFGTADVGSGEGSEAASLTELPAFSLAELIGAECLMTLKRTVASEPFAPVTLTSTYFHRQRYYWIRCLEDHSISSSIDSLVQTGTTVDFQYYTPMW